MPTQEERTARTSAALRRVARRLFARSGFDAVSVDAIAASAGVTRGAFYHHFSSKEALFEAVFDDVEAELAEYAVKAAGEANDPRDQLRLGCLAFIDRAASSPYRRIALMDGPTVLGATRYREIDAKYFLAAIESTVDTINPDRDQAETSLLARVLLAAICECALEAAGPRRDSPAIEGVVGALTRAV